MKVLRSRGLRTDRRGKVPGASAMGRWRIVRTFDRRSTQKKQNCGFCTLNEKSRLAAAPCAQGRPTHLRCCLPSSG